MPDRRDMYLARQPPGSRLAPAWLPPGNPPGTPPGTRLAPARHRAWRAARYPARHPAPSRIVATGRQGVPGRSISAG